VKYCNERYIKKSHTQLRKCLRNWEFKSALEHLAPEPNWIKWTVQALAELYGNAARSSVRHAELVVIQSAVHDITGVHPHPPDHKQETVVDTPLRKCTVPSCLPHARVGLRVVSNRGRRALEHNGIKTIGEAFACGPKKIMSLTQVGKKTFWELVTLFNAAGLDGNKWSEQYEYLDEIQPGI